MDMNMALKKIGAKNWTDLSEKQIQKLMTDVIPNVSADEFCQFSLNNPAVLNKYLKMLVSAEEKLEGIANNILNKNHERVQVILKSSHLYVEILCKKIDDPSVPFEQQKYWSSVVQDELRKMKDFDKKDKKFMLKLFIGVGIGIGAGIGITAALLIAFNNHKSNDDIPLDDSAIDIEVYNDDIPSIDIEYCNDD